jgi:DNA-binding NarL/FixJ family response regulator
MTNPDLIPESSGEPVSRPHHVLVVDGDEHFAFDTAGVARAFGLSASSATSVTSAIDSAERDHPALLVADLDLGAALGGVGLADTIRRRWGASVVLMSTRADPDAVSAMAAADSVGVLCKPFHSRQLEMTIGLALERRASVQRLLPVPDGDGGAEPSRAAMYAALRRIAAEVARTGVVPALETPEPHPEWLESLRPREQEIVMLLLQHQRVPAIARMLSISPGTVRNHLKRVFSQLGVHSQQELVLLLQQPNPDRPGGVPDRPWTLPGWRR